MTNLEITGYAAWATLRQEQVLAEARRVQGKAAADMLVSAAKRVAQWVITEVRAIREGMEHARQLAELSRMSDRELADMGLKRGDIPGFVARGALVDTDMVNVSGLRPWQPATRISNDWTGRDNAAA
jgi:uncharacterized protein YjiS (DUF1127 family)